MTTRRGSRNQALGFAFLLACGLSSAAQAQEEAVDNVVVVLDGSGSMNSGMGSSGQRKIAAAKAAILEVLSQVPASTHVGVVVFGARNISSEWIHPLGPRNDARLRSALGRLQASGGTPLGAYMKKGADRLLEKRKAQFGYGSYRLLLVTDGQAGDQGLVDRYLPDVLGRGITVDVIGVDMKQDHVLATQVHSYRRADDPASLKRAVADVFAEVSLKSGNDAGADFEFIEGISPNVARALLNGLGESGNHPIGQAPPRPVSYPQAPNSAPVPTPAQQVYSSSGPGLPIGAFCCLGCVAVIAILGLMKLVVSRR